MMDSGLFKHNRKNFIGHMENFSVGVFFQKEQVIKGDCEYFDFCDPDLFYLTGIEQPETRLVLYKDKDGKGHEYLFVSKTSKEMEVWEGKKLTKLEARLASSVLSVRFLDDFDLFFNNLVREENVRNFYFYEDKKFGFGDYNLFITDFKKRHSKFKYYDSKDILKVLRSSKQKVEVEQIRKAIGITRKAILEVLGNASSIKNEKDVEAILSAVYTRSFSRQGFHPIIATGVNACTLHYVRNDCKMGRNGLILIDTGAEWNNYKADISRVFPVSGRFTKRQSEVYQAVLDIQKHVISLIKPGIMKKDLEQMFYDFACVKLIELGLFSHKDLKRNKKIGWKFLLHSSGHFLGLDTHDLGDYKVPLNEGQVVTVEPGIYIEKEKLGIRIEDDVLVTKNGRKVLSSAIPKEISDIERLAKR